MARVSTKGQVTIPKEICEALGIGPGDEVAFEGTNSGYKLQKEEPTANEDGNTFEKHRGGVDSNETISE